MAPADVSDADAVERAAQRIEDELGPIDVWINSAMTAVLTEVMDTSPEEFKRVTEVTYLGSVYGVRTALRRMLPRDRGVIVQVGSALSRRGIPLRATYCVSKHAVKGFADSLRAELIHHRSNVQLALVQLPGLNTPQFGWVRTRLRKHPLPVAPVYQPEIAARAIVHAAEHPRRELWVGGSTVYTILGEKFVSGLMDVYLGRTNEKAQHADIPIDPAERHDNLFSPPPGDLGAARALRRHRPCAQPAMAAELAPSPLPLRVNPPRAALATRCRRVRPRRGGAGVPEPCRALRRPRGRGRGVDLWPGGRAAAPEHRLEHLRGYQGAGPVRIANSAERSAVALLRDAIARVARKPRSPCLAAA